MKRILDVYQHPASQINKLGEFFFSEPLKCNKDLEG